MGAHVSSMSIHGVDDTTDIIGHVHDTGTVWLKIGPLALFFGDVGDMARFARRCVEAAEHAAYTEAALVAQSRIREQGYVVPARRSVVVS